MRSLLQFSSDTQLCPTLCDPMDCSTPGLPVHHQLPEFTRTHVHWVGNAIQPSHPLSSHSPPAFNLSQHQGFFKWVSSSHYVIKVLEFQLQHQSFRWILSPTLNTSPVQEVIYFLSLWICLFWTFYINGIVQYVDFCPHIIVFTYIIHIIVFKGHSCCSMYLYFIPVYSIVWLYYKPTHHFMDVWVNFSLLNWGHSYGCVLMALPTQWTCVWANSERQWRTGKPGMLQSMGSPRVRHDLPTEPQQLITHCDF